MFCWIIQGPASRNEKTSPQVKYKTKLADSLSTLWLLDHAQRHSQTQTSLRNGPDRKGLLWLIKSFNWCLWWPKECSGWSCVRNCNVSKHCCWKILHSASITQNTNIKVIFFLKNFTSLKSLIIIISSVSNIMKQFKFRIHGLAFLTSQLLVCLWQLVCTSASFSYLLLQLEPETLLFSPIFHGFMNHLCPPVI